MRRAGQFGRAGGVSHVLSILASNRGIPTLVRCENACDLQEGSQALLMAHEGLVVLHPQEKEVQKQQKGEGKQGSGSNGSRGVQTTQNRHDDSR